MDTVLVTGATGYVGREVVRVFKESGARVTGLGRRRPDEDIPFIQVDLTDTAALGRALHGAAFDRIVHVASLPGDTGDPVEMTRVNVEGCLNLLEHARSTGVKRFVLTSSISAYEWYPATKFRPPKYMPVDEDHPCDPRNIYSTTKRMQELLAMTYFEQYQIPVTVLRLTAVVGPRGRGGGRGYREMALKIAGGKSVQIPHFSADELCHYVDIRDVGRMHLAAAEHPGAVGQIFNCCGPRPTRGSEFASIIRELAPGISVEYGFPWSMAQGGEIAFDMSKAKRLLDFEPLYSIADSMRSIKEWIDAGGLTSESEGDASYAAGVKST